MAVHPFLLTKRVVLNADGTGTWQYTVGTKETFTIKRLFTTSTGAYNITDIRDSTGLHYTNASVNEPIPSSVLPTGTNNYNNVGILPEDMVIDGGVSIYVDLIDTSSAPNTVDLLMLVKREF